MHCLVRFLLLIALSIICLYLHGRFALSSQFERLDVLVFLLVKLL